MTRINRSMKGGKRPRKRMDFTDLREILKDGRQWTALGVVTDVSGDGAVSLDLNEDGSISDILVDVVTQPGQRELVCRMGGMSAVGVVTVPNEGDEVAVLIPDGKPDFQPTIVAILSSQSVPNPDGQGPAQGRTVIVSGEVYIHDGNGDAKELATLEELQGHLHPSAVGLTGVPQPNTQSGQPIIGTQVLKAK